MNDSYKEILIKRNTPVGNKILKGLLIALAAISIFIGLVFWPLLIVGAVLMLLPSGGSTKEQPTPDESLAQLLESVEGVGELRVVISETGVVVACRGADNARVRMDIINAIRSYTGFGSDKITVLKMADVN